MRTLGIDLGARRIGLALSDAGGKLATPLEVLTVSDPSQALEPIRKIVEREGVEKLVIGLPLHMDGSTSAGATAAIKWAKDLNISVPVVFVDERLSSFAAEQDLNDRKRAGEKLTRKRRKEQLDAVAAAGFLQAYLDGKLPAIDVD
jgi:putative Holliday junction resolvase